MRLIAAKGIIADILWHQIPRNAPNVELGEFVVMPNHIHGILILNKPNTTNNPIDVTKQNDDPNSNHVDTLHATYLRADYQQFGQIQKQI
ncbi:hypothetical protein [Peijinzhouia sedimentorum]